MSYVWLLGKARTTCVGHVVPQDVPRYTGIREVTERLRHRCDRAIRAMDAALAWLCLLFSAWLVLLGGYRLRGSDAASASPKGQGRPRGRRVQGISVEEVIGNWELVLEEVRFLSSDASPHQWRELGRQHVLPGTHGRDSHILRLERSGHPGF